jgi:hypothetical protein
VAAFTVVSRWQDWPTVRVDKGGIAMLRRPRLVVLFAAATLAVSGCGGGEDDDREAAPTTSAPATGLDPAPEEKETVELVLQMGARNTSGQDGTATLTEAADGKTRVVLELTNSPAGPQPSHINAGTCDDLGDVAHILGGMRAGNVEATVDASLDSLLAGEFAVSVAKSPQEFGVTVSCADISRA